MVAGINPYNGKAQSEGENPYGTTHQGFIWFAPFRDENGFWICFI
jgi:hypothetical protein